MADSSSTQQKSIVYYKYSLILSKRFIETFFKNKLCKIKSKCLKNRKLLSLENQNSP
jgi:hypothetical protein